MQRAIRAGQAKEPPKGAVKLEIPVHWCDEFGCPEIEWKGPSESDPDDVDFLDGQPLAIVSTWVVPPKVQEVTGETTQESGK